MGRRKNKIKLEPDLEKEAATLAISESDAAVGDAGKAPALAISERDAGKAPASAISKRDAGKVPISESDAGKAPAVAISKRDAGKAPISQRAGKAPASTISQRDAGKAPALAISERDAGKAPASAISKRDAPALTMSESDSPVCCAADGPTASTSSPANCTCSKCVRLRMLLALELFRLELDLIQMGPPVDEPKSSEEVSGHSEPDLDKLRGLYAAQRFEEWIRTNSSSQRAADNEPKESSANKAAENWRKLLRCGCGKRSVDRS